MIAVNVHFIMAVQTAVCLILSVVLERGEKMKCMFECACVGTCLYAVECEDGKRHICGIYCYKCSFESVCTINKQKKKVRKKR